MHTQGKWKQCVVEATKPTEVGDEFLGIAVGDRGICRISAWGLLDDEDKANANLIEAAPLLLEACKEAICCLTGYEQSRWKEAVEEQIRYTEQPYYDIAKVIAEAEGKA